MERNPLPHQKIVYVCLNEREAGPCCAAKGSTDIHALLKEAVKTRGLNTKIRVSRSGCMGRCGNGPNVLVFPDGVWYSGVCPDDVETILGEVLQGIA
ncbi:MAG: Ferredoxin, 2Fe-2S [Candidatus Hydrogenedentes bacterium ADurb.Bin101]|jgi:(2Fe-2S) ferredoxin|nr:MAG: Ferredoxin, 2Fe-2S [Candidatus Hydrogenedentes bacterium ADurb.Bin101]HOC67298.1 (2Fe-2S) ferredoxin domain-containing protein [Candidatus Hydrogenedentota bacterium]